jgi:hypothetical protein
MLSQLGNLNPSNPISRISNKINLTVSFGPAGTGSFLTAKSGGF